jgi:uncharacterized protein with von Willebrand factor type A (vWA) domain
LYSLTPLKALTALILGLETLDAHNNLAKYPVKELVIITDGESEIEWDGVKGVRKQLNARGIAVTVMSGF